MNILSLLLKIDKQSIGTPLITNNVIIKLKDTFIYLFAIVVALLIYQTLNHNIEIALKPLVLAIHLLYQYQFEYIPCLGYKELQGLFIIGKDCLGARLFVCLFSIFIICHLNNNVVVSRWFLHIKALKIQITPRKSSNAPKTPTFNNTLQLENLSVFNLRNKKNSLFRKICKILYFSVISILLSYTITIIRITASIPFCKMNNFNLIHTILSLIIYFASTLILYTFLGHIYLDK